MTNVYCPEIVKPTTGHRTHSRIRSIIIRLRYAFFIRIPVRMRTSSKEKTRQFIPAASPFLEVLVSVLLVSFGTWREPRGGSHHIICIRYLRAVLRVELPHTE